MPRLAPSLQLEAVCRRVTRFVGVKSGVSWFTETTKLLENPNGIASDIERHLGALEILESDIPGLLDGK